MSDISDSPDQSSPAPIQQPNSDVLPVPNSPSESPGSSPAPGTQEAVPVPRSPAQPFIPKDLSYDSLIYFAAWLQDQGKITNEQFDYLHKAAQQMKRTQEELMQTYHRMEVARQALEVPRFSPQQGLPQPPAETAVPTQVQVSEFVNLMNALAAAASSTQQPEPAPPKEEPKSYLLKKGDQAEIEEIKTREETAKKATITGTAGTVSSESMSREEMERQRRERYAHLQKTNEEAAKKREDAERRQRAMDAMWKNDGNPTLGNLK